jgi:RHS repeat-associated protein
VTFYYDALGRKVAKKVGTSSSSSTTTTVFVNADQDTIAEYTNGTLSASYLLGARTDDYVALVKAGKVYWYTGNHLGTVSALTDDLKAVKERYRYNAFGERTILSPTGSTLTASAIGNQIGFTGRYHDTDTGLIDFRFRQYDARLGRFMSRDDEYRDGLNLYLPYHVPNATDPSGHAALALGSPSSSPRFASTLGNASSDPRQTLVGRLTCGTTVAYETTTSATPAPGRTSMRDGQPGPLALPVAPLPKPVAAGAGGDTFSVCTELYNRCVDEEKKKNGPSAPNVTQVGGFGAKSDSEIAMFCKDTVYDPCARAILDSFKAIAIGAITAGVGYLLWPLRGFRGPILVPMPI